MRQTLLLLFVSVALGAGPPNQTSPSSYWSVPLWIDPAGSAVTAADLAASINNQPTVIDKVLQPDSDLIILIVLDLAGDLALVEPAKESLAAELDKLPPNVWIALLHAQEGLSVLADPTADRASVSQLIQSLPISGKAGLFDTLEPAAALADNMLRKADVRVAVLYITDSDVTNYREDLTNPVINSSDPHDLSRRFPDSLIRERAARLERQLAHAGAPVFIVHLQYRASGLNQSYQSALGSLAETTAGFASFCRSTAAIPQEIANMIAYIRSSHFLKLAMPPRPASVMQLRLEWKPEAKSQPHLAYRARLLVKQR